MVKFCIDQLVDGKPYPNLARFTARPYSEQWRQFSQHWPYSEPVHFFEYLDRCPVAYELISWTQADRGALYPVSISYFDFGVDWFDIMPVSILDKLRARSLTVWFFYSEGDNPLRIRQHLDQQALSHRLDPALILFTSANSAADSITGCSHFVDDECLYQLRNQHEPLLYHDHARTRWFTALVRTHKWWRAVTMARLWHQGLDRQGYFSYNKDISIDHSEHDNPIEVDSFGDLRSITRDFLAHCPFHADDLGSDQHNVYANTVHEHFTDSYVNIVLETHMDVDQSNGVFLTEKTFKPIKHCQPFVIVGAAGSIKLLRDMGYRTFDHVINHSYDREPNTTLRWHAVCLEIERLCALDLHRLYVSCRDDLEWNQRLFMSSRVQRVSMLLHTLQQSCHTS